MRYWLSAPWRWYRLSMGVLSVRAFGTCPWCLSDDFHPTLHPATCDVCRGFQPAMLRAVPPEVWQRYCAKIGCRQMRKVDPE